MEETEREVDSVNSEPAMTFASWAIDRNIIESKFLKFLYCPGREHYPGDNRIYKEEKGVCDTGCDTIAAFATGTADHGAGRSTTATSSEGHELKRGPC